MTLFDEIKAKIKNAHVDPCADDIQIDFEVEYVAPEERFKYKREEPVWSLACEQEK
jgi:hypothetical protein